MERLTIAVNDWLGETDTFEIGEDMPLFSAKHDIPYHTFRKYAASYPAKRRALGKAAGNMLERTSQVDISCSEIS